MRYFAYASNMASEIMRERCPGHRALGAARLPGHRLAFTRRSVRTGTGVADIVPAPGCSTWGMLYTVERADLTQLDEKEGRGWAYERTTLAVLLGGGPAREAIAYSVIDKEPEEVRPSLAYMTALLDAARERALPGSYIERLESIRRRWEL